MTILEVSGKVLRSATEVQTADAQIKGIDTRTRIVERLLNKPIQQLGKNDLVAMIVAQYAAIERLILVVAELDPRHPLVVGFRPDTFGSSWLNKLNRFRLKINRKLFYSHEKNIVAIRPPRDPA